MEALLGALGLQHYVDVFLQAGYDDLDVVEHLEEADLDTLGITDANDRCTLLIRGPALAAEARVGAMAHGQGEPTTAGSAPTSNAARPAATGKEAADTAATATEETSAVAAAVAGAQFAGHSHDGEDHADSDAVVPMRASVLLASECMYASDLEDPSLFPNAQPLEVQHEASAEGDEPDAEGSPQLQPVAPPANVASDEPQRATSAQSPSRLSTDDAGHSASDPLSSQSTGPGAPEDDCLSPSPVPVADADGASPDASATSTAGGRRRGFRALFKRMSSSSSSSNLSAGPTLPAVKPVPLATAEFQAKDITMPDEERIRLMERVKSGDLTPEGALQLVLQHEAKVAALQQQQQATAATAALPSGTVQDRRVTLDPSFRLDIMKRVERGLLTAEEALRAMNEEKLKLLGLWPAAGSLSESSMADDGPDPEAVAPCAVDTSALDAVERVSAPLVVPRRAKPDAQRRPPSREKLRAQGRQQSPFALMSIVEGESSSDAHFFDGIPEGESEVDEAPGTSLPPTTVEGAEQPQAEDATATATADISAANSAEATTTAAVKSAAAEAGTPPVLEATAVPENMPAPPRPARPPPAVAKPGPRSSSSGSEEASSPLQQADEKPAPAVRPQPGSSEVGQEASGREEKPATGPPAPKPKPKPPPAALKPKPATLSQETPPAS